MVTTKYMTKISLETEYGIVSIELPKGDLNIQDLWEQAIEPMLLGAGYHQDTINSLCCNRGPHDG